MAAVVVELELASNDDEEGEETSGDDRIPIQLPPEPPLVDVVICRDEEGLPGTCDKDLLKEDLGDVEH